MMVSVLKIHERDPNFPHSVLLRIQKFLGMLNAFGVCVRAF